MKKMLFILPLLALLFLSSACSKDDEPSSYRVMVNVLIDGNIANHTIVRLYDYEEANKCKFDYDAMCEYGDYRKLIDENGNEISSKYTSDSSNGINTFENIEPGRYTIIVMHKPSGFSWPMFYYYGYKEIIVNKDNNAILHKIDFRSEEQGEFVKF